MNFINFKNLIQSELCPHPNDISLLERKLNCSVCQRCVLDLDEYVQRPFDDHFFASAVAQSYHEWTGDSNVALAFTLVDIEGILAKRIQGQTLGRVRECIDLLRALNAPFTTDTTPYKISDSMRTFLSRYLEAIRSEEKMLDQVIRGMHEAIQSKEFSNPFELYFEKLVPYVQRCVKIGPMVVTAEDPNWARELLLQLQRSAAIRKVFGVHSIPLDVLHVLVGCYACSPDMEAVSNFALDFMARVCRGDFFWKRHPDCIFTRQMIRLLETGVTFKKRNHLYNVIREIQRGNAAEGLSAFWPQFLQLQRWVYENYRVPDMPNDIVEAAVHQTFPAVLFQHHGDQLGFTMALGHVIASMDHKTGIVQKGAFKKARQIHEIVRKFIESVEKYETPYWTLDVFRLFLLSEPNLEKEVMETARFLLTEEK